MTKPLSRKRRREIQELLKQVGTWKNETGWYFLESQEKFRAMEYNKDTFAILIERINDAVNCGFLRGDINSFSVGNNHGSIGFTGCTRMILTAEGKDLLEADLTWVGEFKTYFVESAPKGIADALWKSVPALIAFAIGRLSTGQ